jgi:hypothetical protein
VSFSGVGFLIPRRRDPTTETKANPVTRIRKTRMGAQADSMKISVTIALSITSMKNQTHDYK